ncbi:uncharacterized protein TA08010 [Theileria annulata]|uniref:RAP domain-containing protein n=1 Tax=Theileria annulata TaxID=5874 RepID=Q4U9V5_THEAN|nr:uncharacterized protein TA08010 [Theileria annulata]CAI76398.1 hypothetical protein, conserved [Theileria annulata]|eukprot:XP_953023.1 hypothetical protein, conserved [Theileria annulata]
MKVQMCRGIINLSVNLRRILLIKRSYVSLGFKSSKFSTFETKITSQNDSELTHIFDRFNTYLESDYKPVYKNDGLDFKVKLDLCENVSEVCNLFSENKGRITPNELLNLLSKVIQINSIIRSSKNHDSEDNIPIPDFKAGFDFEDNVDYFPPADFCSVSLNNFRTVNIKRLDPRVSEIFIQLVNKSDNLTVEQILYLNRICEFIKGYHTKVILSFSEDKITPSIYKMDETNLIRTAMVLARRSENVDFVKMFISEVFKKIHLFNNSQKMLLFQLMSNSSKCSSIFLTCFSEYLEYTTKSDCKQVSSPHSTFTERDFIRFLTSYANNQKCISKELFKYLLSKCLVADLNELKLDEIMDLLWVSNKFNSVDLFLPKVKDFLGSSLEQIGPNRLTMLLWCYSNSNIIDIQFHKNLEDAAISLSDQLTTKNISLCAYGLSLKSVPGSESRFLNTIQGIFPITLHHDILDDIVSNIIHFNGLDLSMLAYSYSRHLCGSSVLHQCIQEGLINYVEDLPADCITRVVYSYARISGKQSLFNSFVYSIFQRMHQFPIHEFVKVLWSYLAMKFYDHKFWTTCLETVVNKFDLIINDKRCYLLYPVIKILVKLKITPETKDLTRLANHVSKFFWDSQHRNQTSQVVSKVLELIPEVHDVVFDSNEDNFLVDVTFGKSDGTRYSVMIYNSSNMFNQCPIADLRLKELFLSNKGYNIIRVLEDVWVSLDTNDQIKVIQSQL